MPEIGLTETITPERLASLRQLLTLPDRALYGLLEREAHLAASGRYRCMTPTCNTKIIVGYEPAEGGVICEECAVLRLIRGLVALLDVRTQAMTEAVDTIQRLDGDPDYGNAWDAQDTLKKALNEAPPEPEAVMPEAAPTALDTSDYVGATEPGFPIGDVTPTKSASLTEDAPSPPPAPPAPPAVPTRASDFSKHGAGVVQMTPGKKINVMDLPPGTILKFGPVKPSGDVDRSPNYNGREVSPWDAALVRQPGDPHVGPAVVRKYAGHEIVQPEFDLGTLPADVQPLYEGYQPGTRRFQSFEDVKAYEEQVGDPEIMAIFDEQDAEWIAQERALYGDEYVDRMLAGKKIERTNGVATLRTRDDSVKDEVSPGTPQAFPSLSRRSPLS